MKTATAILRPITIDDIHAFHRDGAVLLKGMISDQWLDVLREGLEYANTNPDGMSAGVDKALRIDQFPARRSPKLKSLLTDSPIAEIVGTLLDAPVRFYMDQMFYKPAGLIPPTPWHQDTCYYNIEGHQLVRAWISVDPVPRDISMEVVRGSHLWNITYRSYSGRDRRDDPSGAELAEKQFGQGKVIIGRDSFNNFSYSNGFFDETLPEVPPINEKRDSFDILGWEYAPGDILLFHGNILHGAVGDVTIDHPRRSYASLWAGPDVSYLHRRGQILPDPEALYQYEPTSGQPLSDFPDVFPVIWDNRNMNLEPITDPHLLKQD